MSGESNESGGNTINVEKIEKLYIGGEHHHHYDNAGQNVESDAPTTSQASTQQRGVQLQTDAEQVKKIQLEKVKSDVVTHDKQINEAEIPELHPILVETDIYEGQESNQNEEFIPSTKRKDKQNLDGKIVDFTTLLSLIMTTHFLSLVGPAGSGKTTLSKRIARALLNMGRFVILIKFMNLAYPPGFTLTLQDLIVGHQFNELDKEIRGNAFEWVNQNPGECVLVFDGFDQFSWTLENVKPLHASYDTPLSVQQLIANLCKGEFFGKSHLVFTSRQHSMLSLPYDLRPNLTIHVHDLATDDMKKLFFSFARDNANGLWEIMTTKSPQLFDLCHNPMLLQFIVCAGLYKGANHLNTITNIFNVVFKQIQRSSFAKGREIDRLKQLLGRMAYNGMKCKKILFEAADLTKEGLKDVDVQDFVIKTSKHLELPFQKLFEGDMKFFFMHQLLQEFFAAIYISMHMPVSTFKQTIEAVVNEGHWSMVRRIMCGLLLGNGVHKEKSQIFYDELVQFVSHQKETSIFERPENDDFVKDAELLSKIEGTRFRGRQLAEFLVDLQECSDDVKKSLALKLPLELDFNANPLSLSACHALGDILPRIPHPGVKLYLFGCSLNLDSLKWITNAISKTQHELEWLDLGGNEFGDDGLKLISKYLNKVKSLFMWKCGITKHGIEILVERLKQHDLPLEMLNLGGNEFGDDGLKLISKYLNKVKGLSMWRCGITKHGIEVLVEGLKQLEIPLQVLSLSGNKFGDDGLKLISKYLNKVKRLWMWECGITKHGIEILVEGLKQLELPMEDLDLSDNDFGDDGLKLICECLNKIEELDVRRCDISESGKKLLRKEISKRNLSIENFEFEEQ